MKVQVDSSPWGSAVEDFGRPSVAWIVPFNFFFFTFFKIKGLYCAVKI